MPWCTVAAICHRLSINFQADFANLVRVRSTLLVPPCSKLDAEMDMPHRRILLKIPVEDEPMAGGRCRSERVEPASKRKFGVYRKAVSRPRNVDRAGREQQRYCSTMSHIGVSRSRTPG